MWENRIAGIFISFIVAACKLKYIAGGGAIAGIAFSIFIALAQLQTIYAPYFTPTTIDLKGLQNRYDINGTLNYSVIVKGYGSNCHQLEVVTTRQGANLERVSYYSKADDCRFIVISHGSYNFTRQFEYGGPLVLGEAGTYIIDVTFVDLVDHHSTLIRKSIIVG